MGAILVAHPDTHPWTLQPFLPHVGGLACGSQHLMLQKLPPVHGALPNTKDAEGISQNKCWVGILSLVVAGVPGNIVISFLPEAGR